MKITFPVFSLGEAGGEKIVTQLAMGLSQRGHEVTMIVPRGTSRNFLPDKNLVSIKEVFYHLPKINLLTNSFALAFNTPKSDIICATAGLTSLASFIASKILKRGKPFYYIQHYEPLFYPGLLRFPYRLMIKSSYRFIDNFATDASWLNERIAEESGRKGIIIHPGIDSKVFFPRRVKKDERNRIVLYLGRKGKLRSPEVFFEAIKLIGKRVPNLKIINVTQDKWDYSLPCVYEERVASGEELAKLYSLSDVYVLSSSFEGFPLPPLEAMACGTPVVTTDCLGVRDYAIHGQNSLVVPAGNSLLLSEAIMQSITDRSLAQRLSINGVKIAKNFTIEKTINAFEKTFEDLLKN